MRQLSIDGVLLRSKQPIPGATEAIRLLQRKHIPFILLTNGGGLHEAERVGNVSRALGIPLDVRTLVQSHTPFAGLERYKEQTVLVVGGEGDRCRRVAEKYGFQNVVVPADILVQNPDVWPFSKPYLNLYRNFARPLPGFEGEGETGLQVAAILVFNDPRDWGLDSAIILDLLLSTQGRLGTISKLNGDASLPNYGYQQDGQPPLYFSNPDLWWASAYPLNRLGQGGFREAFEGLWRAVTNGERTGVVLHKRIWGKPNKETYDFAEKRLLQRQKDALAETDGAQQASEVEKLSCVYMIGDNPESDIRGANSYQSPMGISWKSILVETGVYKKGRDPSSIPTMTTTDVLEAVKWAIQSENRKTY